MPQTLRPLFPSRTELDPHEVRLFKEIHENFKSIDNSFRLVGLGFSPTQGARPIPTVPGTQDHGELAGLISVLNADNTLQDPNDDHTQYAFLKGRVGGQTLFGSRLDENQGWEDKRLLVEDGDGVDGTSWASIVLSNGAAVADILIIALASRPVTNVASSGATSIHSTITDTGSNTWTKLQEFSHNAAGADITVSLWSTIVTTALVAGTDTLTVTFATSATSYAMEGRVFAGFAGAIVEIADSTTATTSAVDSILPTMTLSSLTGKVLYTRAIALTNTATGADQFTETAGYRSYIHPDTIHDDATVSVVTIGARGEFLASNNSSASSVPVLATNQTPLSANIFAALRIVSGTGNLKLQAIDFPNVAIIELDDTRIRNRTKGNATNRHTVFENETEVELSYIRSTDGDFVGGVDLGGANLENAGNIFFQADDTYDIGTTTVRPQDFFGRRFSVGDKTTLTQPSNFNPCIIDFQSSQATRTLDGLRIIVENTDTGVTSHSRPLFLSAVLHSGLDGGVLELNRDTTNLVTGILPAAIALGDIYGSAEVQAAIGASFILSSTGGTRAVDLTALTLGASGATGTNYALLVDNGDIVFDADNDRLIFGEGQDASLAYDGTNLIIIPDLVGSGFLRVLGKIVIDNTVLSTSAEKLRITTAIDSYGWKHDDGTSHLASFTGTAGGATGGWLGTTSNHPLIFFAKDAGPRVSINSTPNELRIHTDTDIVFVTATDEIAGIQVQNLLDVTGNHDLVLIGTNSATDPILRFDASAANGDIVWDGSESILDLPNKVRVIEKLGIGSDPQDEEVVTIVENFTGAPAPTLASGINVLALSSQAVEAVSEEELFALFTEVRTTGGGTNAGRVFRRYSGGRFLARFNSNNPITYTTSRMRFTGFDARVQYNGTGVIGTNPPYFIGLLAAATIVTNPGAAMTFDRLWGAEIACVGTASLTNATVVDAIGIHVRADIAGVATATRLYGLKIDDVDPGSSGAAVWGIQCSKDIQIDTDNWLILEGTPTTKGDTGIRYDSGNTRLQFQVNNTDNILMGATTLGLFGVTPVARAAAYTQIFSTATRTHANPTGIAITDNSTGTASQTIAAITGGAASCQTATVDAIASLADDLNKLIVDVANLKQIANSLIDDSQAIGVAQ